MMVRPHDASCFHSQQAAEKYLKAFLCNVGIDFPYTHNLPKRVELTRERDGGLAELEDDAELLTPYAIELRYDQEFWPDESTFEEAISAAKRVRQMVLARLPDAIKSGL